MATTDVAATESEPRRPRRPRLDRTVLVGNIISGVVCLLLALPLTRSVPLTLIGAVYVVAASVFLAAAYAREVLTRGQEALTWAVPWLAAVAWWSWLLAASEGEGAWLLTLWAGLVAGTLCYLPWQLGSLAVRQLMARHAS